MAGSAYAPHPLLQPFIADIRQFPQAWRVCRAHNDCLYKVNIRHINHRQTKVVVQFVNRLAPAPPGIASDGSPIVHLRLDNLPGGIQRSPIPVPGVMPGDFLDFQGFPI
jgi:hypothetical protein